MIEKCVKRHASEVVVTLINNIFQGSVYENELIVIIEYGDGIIGIFNQACKTAQIPGVVLSRLSAMPLRVFASTLISPIASVGARAVNSPICPIYWL